MPVPAMPRPCSSPVLCGLVAAGLLWTTPAAAADDTPAARRAAAEALVATVNQQMGVDKMMGNMQEMMQGQMLQLVQRNERLTPAQQERAAQVLGREMSAAMSETMASIMPAVNAATIDLYVERFTLAELADLQRFYTSPLGTKAFAIMDDLPKLMQPMLQALQDAQPVIAQRIEAAVERLRLEGIDLSPPRGTPR